VSEDRIVVIGASAGGVDALMRVVRGLPPDFAAPVCVVLHIPADSPSLLAHILSREGPLVAKEAADREPLRRGVIYVAPPDRHLLVEKNGTVRVTRGPRENRHRPAVDPLFRSAARAFGPRAIGVVLTGSLDDGTAGLLAIKKQGGVTIVQDPQEALYPSMPQSAIEHVEIDHVLPIDRIARQLTVALQAPLAPGPYRHDSLLDVETRMAEMDDEAFLSDERPGVPSGYGCPDCGGALWEIADDEGEYVRFRCRVGHAFSPENMLGAQDEVLEEALWTAVNTLEESARLSKRLADAEARRGHEWMAERFRGKELEARQRAELIRRALLREATPVPVEADAGESASH
jgi:two-component system, chemotaxis family, protein-glutamate methylesterase/glutaminase